MDKIEQALGGLAMLCDAAVSSPATNCLAREGRDHIATLRAELAGMKEMIELAEGIMDTCGGDAWERECTEDDRRAYAELKAKHFPTPVDPIAAVRERERKEEILLRETPATCDRCGTTHKGLAGLQQHQRDKHGVPWPRGGMKAIAALDRAREVCNCASGRGAEHCTVHAATHPEQTP